MKIVKRIETTVEAHERWVIRSARGSATLWCVHCSAQRLRTTPDEAAKLMGVSTRTIYRWAESGRIHFTEPLEGGLLICIGSLPPKDP
jgi:DNA binding domain, excisionase family